MPVAADNGSRRKKLLLLVMLVLAVVFAAQFSGVSLGELPTKALVQQEAARLRAGRKSLGQIQRQTQRDDTRLQGLSSQATPFWTVSSRRAQQEVREELDALVRHAQITSCRVQNLPSSPLTGYNYFTQVEFSVSLVGTMKVVTRLLNEMERSEHVFTWSQCSLSTTSRTAPKEVRLNGKVRALVLAAEAQGLLAMTRGDEG
jgi:hypothetical protein